MMLRGEQQQQPSLNHKSSSKPRYTTDEKTGNQNNNSRHSNSKDGSNLHDALITQGLRSINDGGALN